jgi:hypothetical protein
VFLITPKAESAAGPACPLPAVFPIPRTRHGNAAADGHYAVLQESLPPKNSARLLRDKVFCGFWQRIIVDHLGLAPSAFLDVCPESWERCAYGVAPAGKGLGCGCGEEGLWGVGLNDRCAPLQLLGIERDQFGGKQCRGRHKDGIGAA